MDKSTRFTHPPDGYNDRIRIVALGEQISSLTAQRDRLAKENAELRERAASESLSNEGLLVAISFARVELLELERGQRLIRDCPGLKKLGRAIQPPTETNEGEGK